MATLYVKDLPDDLYARLVRRAEMHRRSVSAEVLALLDWALVHIDRSPDAVLSSILRRRSFAPDRVGAPDSTTLLREDRNR
jgi:plasmid stability protein